MTLHFHVILVFFATAKGSYILDKNREYLESNSGASGDPLVSWKSSSCRQFYSGGFVWGKRPPPFLAVEDMHVGGRNFGIMQNLPAQEVIVSDAFKFVYIVVRKSASALLRGRLKREFGADWTWCQSACASVPSCTFNGGERCTTFALNQTHLQHYYFFTFVRNPIDRWFSGYSQAQLLGFRTKPEDAHRVITRQNALDNLDKLSHEGWAADEPLQSQVHSLTSLLFNGLPPPLHFIGKVENIDEDWQRLRSLLFERANQTPSFALAKNLEFATHSKGNRVVFDMLVNDLRNDSVIRRAILEAYTQDFACLGYNASL